MGVCKSSKSEIHKDQHKDNTVKSDNRLIYMPKHIPTDINIQVPKRITTLEKVSKEDHNQVKELVGILKQNTFQRENINFNSNKIQPHFPRINTDHNKSLTTNINSKINVISNTKSDTKYQREDFNQIKELAKLTKQGTNFQDYLQKENRLSEDQENGQMFKMSDKYLVDLPELKDLKKDSEKSKNYSDKNLHGYHQYSQKSEKGIIEFNQYKNINLNDRDPSQIPAIIQEEHISDTPFDEASIDNEINPAAMNNIDVKSINCNRNQLN